MAINYAIKYATKIAERFKKASITADDCGNSYSWLNPNSRTIRIGSVNTVPETQYTRSGSNRFGEVHDVGDTLQEMTCEQQPAFSFTIDALDQTDQAIQKSAGSALRRQLDAAGCPQRAELPFHKLLLDGTLPLTMGGGIGQSRLCMLLLGKAHVGEVQVSLWDDATIQACRNSGVELL